MCISAPLDVGSAKANFALTTKMAEVVPKKWVTVITECRDNALQSNVKAHSTVPAVIAG